MTHAGERADPALRALIHEIDPSARLISTQPLQGGISARIVALDLVTATGPASWVLRTLPVDPDLDAATEFRLMGWLAARAFPVPTALACLDAGPDRPRGAVLMTREPGAVIANPDGAQIDALAALLTQLHALPTDGLDFLPPLCRYAMPSAWSDLDALGANRSQLERLGAVAQRHAPRPTGPRVLGHGDFWVGNLLQRPDRGVLVLDWEDAGLGDRLQDLAIARLELLWECDARAMTRFTDAYLAQSPDPDLLRTGLPAWDLTMTLLRLSWLPAWGLPDAITRTSLDLGVRHAEDAAARLTGS
ncbi:MAG: phosphotransferase [Pseudomonadales bacterium]|nr:phosphotransferase [Pseudomonadales bacterium]